MTFGHDPASTRLQLDAGTIPLPGPVGYTEEEAIAEAVTVRVGDETTRVFTPEHAVAIALRTWRGKDREHIDRLIRTGRRPLETTRLRDILQRYGLQGRWQRFEEMYDVHLG